MIWGRDMGRRAPTIQRESVTLSSSSRLGIVKLNVCRAFQLLRALQYVNILYNC